ncbi:MAG: multicopper oxidase domain-containing protein [bacterium]
MSDKPIAQLLEQTMFRRSFLKPGPWAFHCHILPCAESEHGPFGMVTARVVQK